MFGHGSNQYPGMLATEEIGEGEVIVYVPAKMVLSTKRAFQSELKEVFIKNPLIFGRQNIEGDDNIMISYLLHEYSKGENSFWYPMFEVLPKDTDILMNWDEADLEQL